MTEPVTWTPDRRVATIWQVGGTAIFAGSLLFFAYLAVGDDAVRITFADFLFALLLAAGILVVHEGIHGAAMRLFGARPRFGAKMINRSMPALYCTTPGHRFTRGQFLVVALAPLVLLTLGGVPLLTSSDWGGRLVLALAFNTSGAIGDLWIAGIVIRARPGTMIEDLEDGIRLHPST